MSTSDSRYEQRRHGTHTIHVSLCDARNVSYASLDTDRCNDTRVEQSPRCCRAASPHLATALDIDSFRTSSTRALERKLSAAPASQHRPNDSSRKRKTVTLLSAHHIGLLVSLAFASVLTSCIKRGLVPLLQSELGMTTTQVDAAQILLILPWACSFVLGFCSDALPIFGRQRKPYMVLGWCVTSLALLVLAFVYYTQEFVMRSKRDSSSGATADHRLRMLYLYVVLLGFTSFGGILSVVVAEIYVVQLSRRELLQRRGHMLGTFLLTQFVCEMLGQVITDVVIFRVTKLGVFPVYSFQTVVLFFVCYALVPIPVLLCGFHEQLDTGDGDDDQRLDESEACELKPEQQQLDGHEPDDHAHDRESPSALASSAVAVLGGDRHRSSQSSSSSHDQRCSMSYRTSLKTHATAVYETLQRTSTWRIVRFLALFVVCAEFTLAYPHAMLERWCHVTLKLTSSSKILSEAMYAIAVVTWQLLCLDMDWRALLASALVGFYVVPQAIYAFLVVGGIGRNAQTYVVFVMLRGFVRSVIVIVQVSLAIEIAPVHSEGAVVGLLVSLGTAMRLLAATTANALDRWLASPSRSASNSDDSDSDSPATRRRVALLLALCFSVRLLALLGLLYLPKQKHALQTQLRADRRSRCHAHWTFALLSGALAIVASANAWVVTPT